MVGDSSDINKSRCVSDFVEHRGFLSAYGSYQIYYESALLKETSPATITWVGTVEGVLVILGGVASGPVYDRGFVRELLLVGSALVVAGIILLSLSTKFYQVLLTQGFCVGIGSGMLYTPSIALVSSCFHKRRAHAICLATCGTAFGMSTSVSPPCLATTYLRSHAVVQNLTYYNRWNLIPYRVCEASSSDRFCVDDPSAGNDHTCRTCHRNVDHDTTYEATRPNL